MFRSALLSSLAACTPGMETPFLANSTPSTVPSSVSSVTSGVKETTQALCENAGPLTVAPTGDSIVPAVTIQAPVDDPLFTGELRFATGEHGQEINAYIPFDSSDFSEGLLETHLPWIHAPGSDVLALVTAENDAVFCSTPVWLDKDDATSATGNSFPADADWTVFLDSRGDGEGYDLHFFVSRVAFDPNVNPSYSTALHLFHVHPGSSEVHVEQQMNFSNLYNNVRWDGQHPWVMEDQTIKKLAFDGEVLEEHELPDATHDFDFLGDGDIAYLAYDNKECTPVSDSTGKEYGVVNNVVYSFDPISGERHLIAEPSADLHLDWGGMSDDVRDKLLEDSMPLLGGAGGPNCVNPVSYNYFNSLTVSTTEVSGKQILLTGAGAVDSIAMIDLNGSVGENVKFYMDTDDMHAGIGPLTGTFENALWKPHASFVSSSHDACPDGSMLNVFNRNYKDGDPIEVHPASVEGICILDSGQEASSVEYSLESVQGATDLILGSIYEVPNGQTFVNFSGGVVSLFGADGKTALELVDRKTSIPGVSIPGIPEQATPKGVPLKPYEEITEEL